VGVELFFALSGFLITSLLLREWRTHGDLDLPRFWARRLFRLVPALGVAVLLAIAVSWWHGMELRPAWIASALFYGSNLVIAYAGVYPLGVLSHTWSLGMEEQFYLLWPLLLLGALRFGKRGVVVTAAALCVVPALLRLHTVASHPADPQLWLRVYFSPHLRIDAIAVGCLAGAWLSERPAWGRTGAIGAGIAALAGALWLVGVALHAEIRTVVATPVLLSVTSLAAAAVVVASARLRPVAALLSFAPLVWVGRISYGLYLVHVIVFVALGDWSVWIRWLAAFAVAVLSYALVETPFLRRKHRFDRRTSRLSEVMSPPPPAPAPG